MPFSHLFSGCFSGMSYSLMSRSPDYLQNNNLCHRCFMPSFFKIGPPVPEKKIFEGFIPYMGMAAILVM